MRVLIVGGRGQLGLALSEAAPVGYEIVSCGSDLIDIRDSEAVEAAITAIRPALLLNAAGYTAVDEAERHEVAAAAVNAAGVGNLARAARSGDARFVHVSTDYVFDGQSGSAYRPDSQANPLSAYGRTKLAGEELAGSEALVVRSAWLYSKAGSNFVLTMLRQLKSHPEVRVVADQIGTPTYAPSLASAIWSLVGRDASGVYHYTDSGVASWYDFAAAIREEAISLGMMSCAGQIVPVATADYPRAAPRPPFSVLDKTATTAALGRAAPHWRSNLRIMLQERINC